MYIFFLNLELPSSYIFYQKKVAWFPYISFHHLRFQSFQNIRYLRSWILNLDYIICVLLGVLIYNKSLNNNLVFENIKYCILDKATQNQKFWRWIIIATFVFVMKMKRWSNMLKQQIFFVIFAMLHSQVKEN